MRYVIQHASTDNPNVSTFSAVLAENRLKAINLFTASNPARVVLKVTPVATKEAAFHLFGLGGWTDEEQAEHRAKMNVMNQKRAAELSEIEAGVLELSPEEFTAEMEYSQRRSSEKTQNAEGVHIGDIFYSEWGYEQTNIDFYQVVALKGKHTAILRRNREKRGTASSLTGYARPIRDCFEERGSYADPVTCRTKLWDYNGRKELYISANDHLLQPVQFGKAYEFTCYA